MSWKGTVLACVMLAITLSPLRAAEIRYVHEREHATERPQRA